MIFVNKAIRAMWENKKAYIACIVLVCVGITLYECLGIASRSLIAAKDDFYRQYRLADAFASVKSLPAQDIDKLLSIKGVNDVLGRQVYEARVVMPENEKIITLKLISADTGLTAPLNGILINDGDWFRGEKDIMLNSGFLSAHRLRIGDSLLLIIDGREQIFNICAAVQGPDFVSVVRENDPTPDEETFGMAYIQEKTLFGLTGKSAYNDISFELEQGYSYDEIKVTLEDALERYGLVRLYPKKDQISYAALDTKTKSYVSLSQVLPFCFVFMSAVILYLMLKRVIELDRTQIGTMKGIGYSDFEIVGHYMFYGGATGFTGGVTGCACGYFLADLFMQWVGSAYHLPNLTRTGVWGYMANGIIISVATGVFGSFAGASGILKLIPAEAMRPPAPKSGKNSVGKLDFLSGMLLNSRGNLALRGITRNKLRSLFVVIGIMFSFGLLTVMSSYSSLIDTMLTSQFTKVELYDGKISFVQPVSYSDGVASALNQTGVTVAEGVLEIPAELKSRHLSKTALITGLARDSELYKVHDDLTGKNLTPPDGSVILNDLLAAELAAKVGDVLYVSSPLLTDDIEIIVSGIAAQSMGQSCFMEIGGLANMFGLDRSVTSVIFNSDSMGSVRNSLTNAKNVSAIKDTAAIVENYQLMMAPVNTLLGFMVVMAVIVAFAIIYNTSAISLSEQKREYSTLMVLGLQVNEVAEVLKFENWTLCAIGMILGVPFARFMTIGISGLIDMDPFKFPTDTPMYAFFVGLAGCVVAVYLSNRSSIKNIDKFDLVEVLKDRE